MKLRIDDVMRRCDERGYSWQDIQPCISNDLGDGWLEVDVFHESYPRGSSDNVEKWAQRDAESKAASSKENNQGEPRGLGDMVSSALSAVGITKERVSKAIGRPCGCGERQAALNSLGAKYLGIPEGSTAKNSG